MKAFPAFLLVLASFWSLKAFSYSSCSEYQGDKFKIDLKCVTTQIKVDTGQIKENAKQTKAFLRVEFSEDLSDESGNILIGTNLFNSFLDSWEAMLIDFDEVDSRDRRATLRSTLEPTLDWAMLLSDLSEEKQAQVLYFSPVNNELLGNRRCDPVTKLEERQKSALKCLAHETIGM